MPASLVIGSIAAFGTRPTERSAASTMKPTMNHGTNLKRSKRFGASAAARRRGASGRRGASSDSAMTTGPSISTRTSLTSVPICVLTSPAGTVAASTCGTA